MATWTNKTKGGEGRTWAEATIAWNVSFNTWASLFLATWSILTANTSTFVNQNKKGIVEWADNVFLWDDPVLTWSSQLNSWTKQTKN